MRDNTILPPTVSGDGAGARFASTDGVGDGAGERFCAPLPPSPPRFRDIALKTLDEFQEFVYLQQNKKRAKVKGAKMSH